MSGVVFGCVYTLVQRARVVKPTVPDFTLVLPPTITRHILFHGTCTESRTVGFTTLPLRSREYTCTNMEYSDMANAITSAHDPFRIILHGLPYMSFKQRKVMMTLARVQQKPSLNMFIHRQIEDMLQTIVPSPHITQNMTLHGYVLLVEQIFGNPAKLALFSSMIRCAPVLNEEGFTEMIHESIAKELKAHLSDDRPQQFCYKPIFEIGQHHTPIHPYPIFRDPRTALNYCEAFHNWIDGLRGKILYPQYSRKALGRISSQRLIFSMDDYGLDRLGETVSTLDAYNHYFRNGVKTDGPCEVHYALKYNDVKPRIYYRNGCSAFWESLYIHDLIDEIMGLFPHTRASTRYNLQRIHITGHDALAFVYDYGTFTSNLAELKYFMDAVSQFASGHTLFLWDAKEGLIPYDAGQLLQEYTDACCRNAEFDLGAILEDDHPVVMLANLAGLLGVYGNINSSLSLHGLSLCFICKGSRKCTCIGDDAFGVLRAKKMKRGETRSNNKAKKKTLVENAKSAIRILGDISDPKTIFFDVTQSKVSHSINDEIAHMDTHGWHYVKRPMYVADYQILQGVLYDLPLPVLFLTDLDKLHTVRPGSIEKRRKDFIQSYCSFLDQLLLSNLSDEVAELFETYIALGYSHLRIPKEGSMPGSKKNPPGTTQLVIPPASRRIFGCDWREYCWENRDGPFIMKLPRDLPQAEDLPGQPELGYTFSGRMHPSWRAYVDLGLLTTKELKQDCLMYEANRHLYDRHLTGKIPKSYLFTVNDYLPSCWLDAYTSVPVPLYIRIDLSDL